MFMGDVMVWSALAIAILMVGTWLLSVILKNASIVDIVWGLGFVVTAWVSRGVGDGDSGRQWLLTILTSIWGLRLAGYLLWRNAGHGEDFRYKSMRKRWGARFPLISLVTVFALQGVLMWIVSLPVQLGQDDATPGIGVLSFIGIAVFAFGLFFEVVGDAQLARFKSDQANAGKVMDQGLWRYTRHPNYFGDACVWWGLALIAAETGSGAWGFIGAIVMTYFLRRVSGVTLLERSLKKRREGYEAYIARTSPFIPRRPKALS
jgi:steroid 5-alpha reductase family enzyme